MPPRKPDMDNNKPLLRWSINTPAGSETIMVKSDVIIATMLTSKADRV